MWTLIPSMNFGRNYARTSARGLPKLKRQGKKKTPSEINQAIGISPDSYFEIVKKETQDGSSITRQAFYSNLKENSRNNTCVMLGAR